MSYCYGKSLKLDKFDIDKENLPECEGEVIESPVNWRGEEQEWNFFFPQLEIPSKEEDGLGINECLIMLEKVGAETVT